MHIRAHPIPPPNPTFLHPPTAPLTEAEQEEALRILRQGGDMDTVVSAFNVQMLRQHLRTLRPRTWLNDEVGHCTACLPACLPACLLACVCGSTTRWGTALRACLPACLPACLRTCVAQRRGGTLHCVLACLPACLPACLRAWLNDEVRHRMLACLLACLRACGWGPVDASCRVPSVWSVESTNQPLPPQNMPQHNLNQPTIQPTR